MALRVVVFTACTFAKRRCERVAVFATRGVIDVYVWSVRVGLRFCHYTVEPYIPRTRCDFVGSLRLVSGPNQQWPLLFASLVSCKRTVVVATAHANSLTVRVKDNQRYNNDVDVVQIDNIALRCCRCRYAKTVGVQTARCVDSAKDQRRIGHHGGQAVREIGALCPQGRNIDFVVDAGVGGHGLRCLGGKHAQQALRDLAGQFAVNIGVEAAPRSKVRTPECRVRVVVRHWGYRLWRMGRCLPLVPSPTVALDPERQVGSDVATKALRQAVQHTRRRTVRDPKVT